jgi:hypothetical protein
MATARGPNFLSFFISCGGACRPSQIYIGKLAQRQVVAVSAGLSDKLPQSW